MSKKVSKISTVDSDASNWSVLLDEMKTEYWDSNDLTEDEKRFLDKMELMPEAQWEPISSVGKNISEVVIEERGTKSTNTFSR